MKIILFALLGSCFIITLNARLIEKNTDRTSTTESKTTGSSPPIRLTRDVFEEDALTGFSKEDNLQSDEIARSYNRKARHHFNARTSNLPGGARVVRESSEKTETVKNATTTSSTPVKTKPTLVAKPIPKYNEVDYDDDFQMKISRSPVRVIDSGEHEDEDFNLDDYDFDVNHDEFIGRGKPLEPRTKHKDLQHPFRLPPVKSEPKIPATPPEVKTQSKLVSPNHRFSNKKERAAEAPPKQRADKDDYYDDSPSTKVPEKPKSRDQDDEFNDDNEESKEFEGKVNQSSVRMARSPWKINNYVDKLGEKTSSVMSKVLSILPMFPQVPDKNRADHVISGRRDSWTGKH
ncbi:unnamed protein product [Chrysodeixis includens]|uniref:Uncharacterized protein n=1 Tax=Chrysodeixis includens TaxID=689277 RepID=A0A9P0BUB1_CHRIL|nr:unnamed protein product [Chrysodeixis includens]